MKKNPDASHPDLTISRFREYFLLSLLVLGGLLIASYLVTDTTVVIPNAEDLAEWRPYRRMAAEAWGQGRFPLWSSQMLCGLPLAGWPHASAFYPLGLIFGTGNFSTASTINLFVHVLIFGLGTIFMLRGLKIGWEASALAACFVSFGPLLSNLQFNALPTTFTVAWAPWLFGCAFHLLESKRLPLLLGMAASFALQVLGGRYDFILRELIVMGMAAAGVLILRRGRADAIGLWLLGGLLGLLLAGLAFLVHYEYIGQSLRRLPVGYVYYRRFQRDSLMLVLLLAWVVTPSCLLALRGLGFKARRVVVVGAALTLGLTMMWLLSPDFWVRLNYHLPVLGQARWPNVAYFLVLLALAVLTGEGISGWIERGSPQKWAAFAGPLLVVFGLGYLFAAWRRDSPGLSELGLFTGSLLQGKLVSGVGLLALGGVLVAGRLRRRGDRVESRRLRVFWWAALIGAGVFLTAGFGTIRRPAWSPSESPLFPSREDHKLKPYRHLNLFPWSRWREVSIPIQSGSEPGGRSIDGFISMPVMRYGEFLSLIDERALTVRDGRIEDERFMSLFKEGDFLSPRALALLEFLNVRYYVVEEQNLKFVPLYLLGLDPSASAKERDPRRWSETVEIPKGAKLAADLSATGPAAATLVAASEDEPPRLLYSRLLDSARLPVEIPLNKLEGAALKFTAGSIPVDRAGGAAQWISPRLLLPDRPLTLVSLQGDLAIYEDRRVFPQAFIVHEARVIADHDARLDYLREHGQGLREKAVLEQEPDFSPEPSEQPEGVELREFENQSLLLRAKLDASGLVVLGEVWYPGWRAWEGKKELPILRANHAFRALALPPGQHAVRMSYEPVSFRIGLWCTLAALGAVAFALLKKKLVRR